MKSIKILAITLLLGTTLLSANADKFAAQKEIALTHLTKKIELINTYKSCLQSSTDKKAMKACRVTFKSAREALRSETKAKRKALKAKK